MTSAEYICWGGNFRDSSGQLIYQQKLGTNSLPPRRRTLQDISPVSMIHAGSLRVYGRLLVLFTQMAHSRFGHGLKRGWDERFVSRICDLWVVCAKCLRMTCADSMDDILQLTQVSSLVSILAGQKMQMIDLWMQHVWVIYAAQVTQSKLANIMFIFFWAIVARTKCDYRFSVTGNATLVTNNEKSEQNLRSWMQWTYQTKHPKLEKRQGMSR